jgi:hypothetical protein
VDIECSDTETILEVKKKIIKELSLPAAYIDIAFDLDKPSRVMGKFNIESGRLARTLDRYTVERFAFKERMAVVVTEVTDYKEQTFMSGGKKKRVGLSMTSSLPNLSKFDTESTIVTMDQGFVLRDDDFPSL